MYTSNWHGVLRQFSSKTYRLPGGISLIILYIFTDNFFDSKSCFQCEKNSSWGGLESREEEKLHCTVELPHCKENTIRPHSQFPHSCVCERFIYSQDRSTYSCSRIGRSIVEIYKSLTDKWMWKLWPRNSFSGNISVLVLCSAYEILGLHS